ERAGRPGDRDEPQPTGAQRFELRVEQPCGDRKRAAGPVEAEHEIPLVARFDRELCELLALSEVGRREADALGRDGEPRKMLAEEKRPAAVDAGRLEDGAAA